MTIAHPKNHPTNVNILIAEDSATQLQRLKHILEQRDYEVTAAPNGRLALEAAQLRKPTLLISDVVMPEMDGYSLCRELKNDPRLGDVPVILVTTLADPQDVIRGLECRADHFILKPYDENYLLGRVQFVLLNREMRRHHEQPGSMGLEIFFNGQKHFITADRLQILNLLLSTYEAAIHRNKELTSTQDALRQSNSELQQLTRDLEDRVLERTHELERANEDLRRTQQAAMQQERLRALGQMASGIAHDINNALSPAALYLQSLLEREPGLSDNGRGHLVTIQRAVDDVAQTVARMREFYRPRESQIRLVNLALNELIRQVLDLTRARWNDQPQQRGAMIELKTDLGEDLPEVLGAESEIRDALTNLIFNAVDAMPEGGTLTVRTRSAEVALPQVEESAYCAILEVADTGVGMSEETRRRCLEPFFTTKGERGTGLGLPMVYGMAQRHGAGLEIDSEVGQGTTFRLLFPASNPSYTATLRAPAALAPLRPLNILIVDDDPLLLESLRVTLEADQHHVTAAEGGQAGIDRFLAAQRGSQGFDAVICDLGMPYVDGRKVVETIRAASPSTPIILLTGWGQRTLGKGDKPLQVDRLLSKPPRLRELREALAQLCAAQ